MDIKSFLKDVQADNAILVYKIEPEDLKNHDIEPMATALEQLLASRQSVVNHRDTVMLVTSAYDDDPREVYDIPEYRGYVRSLDQRFPYWFWFLFKGPCSSLLPIYWSLMRLSRAGGRPAPNLDDMRHLMERHFIALNRLCSTFKLDGVDKNDVTRQVGAFFRRVAEANSV